MKNIIRITFLTFILSVVVIGCGGGHKSETTVSQQTAEDTVIATLPQVVRGRIVEDAVIGHWTIKALKDSNDVIVGRHDWAVRDSSVFLTLSYDRNIVYSDKEIRTKDLVGNEGEYMMQWGGEVFWASDSAVYLSFGCFLPDTDDGWNMLYQILPDGTSNIIVIDVYMGVDGFDVVAEFMALYLNERAVGASADDLKRLFDNYCMKDVADKLAAGTAEIVYDDTDLLYGYKTIHIEPQDGFSGLPLDKYSFNVEFKPNPKDENITAGIFIEVDGSSNKISKIDNTYRKVI
ncbi:hypothetical protein F1988_02275 [Alistipes indistinctus]|nr:hypothetical protein F1988_02275 [Alistipes indistinctus]